MGEQMFKKNFNKKDFFLVFFSVIFLIVFINITIFKVYWVPSKSMEPALCENDFVYVYQLPYIFGYGEPEYGELLVFKYPLDQRYDYIKRLIGKPGDIIQIKDNKIIRNDILIEEEYLHENSEIPDYESTLVPEDSYFFLGDNRKNSKDSREWGFVEKSLIKGKAIYIVWPLERTGEIE